MNTKDDNEGLSFDEILEILEEELLASGVIDNENPYRPLNFHEADEGFEE